MNDRVDDEKKLSWPTIGWFVTCGYILSTLLLFYIAGPRNVFGKIEGLQLNAIGDFLAGLFAPLAFIWLFVATMVQSEELALQRKELRLTRHEFEQNRDVATAQAIEAKRQAEYMQVQADVLKAEWETKQRDQVDQLFDKLLDVLEDHLRSDRLVLNFRFGARSHQFAVTDGSSDDRERYLASYRHALVIYVNVVRNEHHLPDYCPSHTHRFISDAVDLLSELIELTDRCSRSIRLRAILLNLDLMKGKLEELGAVVAHLAKPDFISGRLRIAAN